MSGDGGGHCLGSRLISHVSGRCYAEAMILATSAGLDIDEPAWTQEEKEKELRQENDAQRELARIQMSLYSDSPRVKPARRSTEEPYPSRGTLVFGVIDRGCGTKNLVFMPQKEAERLRAIREALESRTWGEFRRRVPRADYDKLLEIFAHDYLWLDFDEFCSDQAEFRDREELWEEYTLLPVGDRPPLDDDDPRQIPGLGDFDWPGLAEQLMLRCLPEDVLEAYGEVDDGGSNGPFLILDPVKAPEIIAALENQGYRCAWEEELVTKACGYSPPTEGKKK